MEMNIYHEYILFTRNAYSVYRHHVCIYVYYTRVEYSEAR